MLLPVSALNASGCYLRLRLLVAPPAARGAYRVVALVFIHNMVPQKKRLAASYLPPTLKNNTAICVLALIHPHPHKNGFMCICSHDTLTLTGRSEHPSYHRSSDMYSTDGRALYYNVSPGFRQSNRAKNAHTHTNTRAIDTENTKDAVK